MVLNLIIILFNHFIMLLLQLDLAMLLILLMYI